MGQLAVLFCLDESKFQELAAQPESYAYWQVALASEGFDQTFEGLRFLLSKGQTPETVELLQRLFEPATFVGQEVDYELVDWEALSDEGEAGGTAVYYHAPAAVRRLATHLAAVSDDQFRQAFDPDEMNRAGVYPGVWNRNTGEDDAFNEQALVNEWQKLQRFLAHASEGSYYCICSIR